MGTDPSQPQRDLFETDELLEPVENAESSAGFSLRQMFFVVTLVATYLGLFQVSPGLANFILLLVGPATARTLIAEEHFRQRKLPFSTAARWGYFVWTIGIMLAAMFVAAATFVAVCLLFGIIASLFGVAIAMSDFWFENAVLGSLGGMVIGAGVAFVAFGTFLYFVWPIRDHQP